MTNGSLVKEFYKLLKNVGKMSDGQAVVSDWDDADVATFKLEIKPHGGVYRGGTFLFKVTLDDDFPMVPPTIRCETPIYHPNIDPTEECDDTNICLNMFTPDEWQEGYGFDGVIQGLLFLFYEPNLDDPLSPYFDGTQLDDFESNVVLSLKGEEIEGYQFPWNYGERDEDGEKVEDLNTGETERNGTKNDNSEETTSNNVPKGDDQTDHATNADISENKCVPEQCNTDLSNKDLPTGSNPEEILDKETLKGSTLGITIKPKEHVAQTSVISQTAHDQPDVIPVTNDDCSASCPDIITMTTDDHVTCRELKTGTTQKKVTEFVVDKLGVCRTVSLHSYDAVIPEMNFVFAMLNNVTKAIET